MVAYTLSLQSRLAGQQKPCRPLSAGFSSYAAACTIAAVRKKSPETCKGVARSSTETPMWLLPIGAEEEDARQARKCILIYALLKEENRAKKHGSKVQIMEKRKSSTERGMGQTEQN